MATSEAGTGLTNSLPLEFITTAHQSICIILRRVTLYVPTKQREFNRRTEPETKTHRRSYTTGRLSVRLDIGSLAQQTAASRLIHTNTHILRRMCLLSALSTHIQSPTHTVAKSPAGVRPSQCRYTYYKILDFFSN